MTMIETAGKRIALWGYGREGKASYRWLRARGDYNDLTVIDDELNGPDGEAVVTAKDIADEVAAGHFNIIIKSPGVSLYDRAIVAAKEKGTLVTSGSNIWFSENPDAKTIVITGTKGKSTTSSLLSYVLGQSGLDVVLGGNGGVPLLDVKPGDDYTVIEMSSYQLADLALTPNIFCILNLSPAHVPWHRTKKTYYNDKLSPSTHQPAPVIISNAQSKTLKEYLKVVPDFQFNKTDMYYVQNGTVFNGDKKLNIQTRLKGEHNLENIAAVLTIARAIGVSEDDILPHFKSYVPLPHRLQELGEHKGVLYVNDSISTTPSSTLKALETYDGKPIHLIMGGTEQGQGYETLYRALDKYNIQKIYILPSNGFRILTELKEQGFSFAFELYKDLGEAVKDIKNTASSGDVVLLSPAAASFGQFKDFEERGEAFEELVRS